MRPVSSARALAGSRLQETTAKKKLLSELAYMAPEQVEAGAFVDHLADLYAVGAVVYIAVLAIFILRPRSALVVAVLCIATAAQRSASGAPIWAASHCGYR